MKSAKVVELGAAPSAPKAPAAEPEAQREALLVAAMRGNEDAMQALVVTLLPRVRNLVRYLVRSDEVDDLTQDALLRVVEKLAGYRGEGSLESWSDGVTLRVVLNRMRKERAEARRTDPTTPDELPTNVPAEHLHRFLMRQRTVRALDKLPDSQRHVTVMHHVLGMTVPEIAAELGTPVETVRSRLRLGMTRIRSSMRRQR